LPYDVERMLSALIEKELKFFQMQEKLKADLVSRFDYTMQDMFKELDDWNYKYIDMKNLKRFLIKTSVYPDDSALKAIIRRLDTDGDARLSFREFQMAVQPLTAFRLNTPIEMEEFGTFGNNTSRNSVRGIRASHTQFTDGGANRSSMLSPKSAKLQ